MAAVYSGISVKISWNHVNTQNLFPVLFNGNCKNICFCLLPWKALGKAKSPTGTEEMFTFSYLITVCLLFHIKIWTITQILLNHNYKCHPDKAMPSITD